MNTRGFVWIMWAWHVAAFAVLAGGAPGQVALAGQGEADKENEAEGTRASLVLEAEDFRPVGDGVWRVIPYGENYFVDAIGNAYISGEKLLSAPAECRPSVARLVARVPRAGRYKAWVHYEAPKDYNTRFGLIIEQAGRKVLDADMGGADQLRLWPFSLGLRTQINPGYGGGDNVTWQGAEVELSAGEAVFTLTTLDNPEPAARRNIDVVYLTSDLSDTPKNRMDPFLDELPRPGRLWVRIRNEGERPLKVGTHVHLNRRNWRINESLYEQSGLKRLHEEIAPGAWSPWVDAGPVIDTIHGPTLRFSPEPREGFGGAVVEIAHEPDAAVRWRYHWMPDETPLHVWVPVDLDLEGIVTSDQMYERIRGYVEGRAEGPTPKRIKFFSRFGGGDRAGRHAKWWDLYYAFGYAGPGFGLDKYEPGWERIFGGDSTRKGIGLSWQDPRVDLEELRRKLSDPAYRPVFERLEVFSIGDEIGIHGFGDRDPAPAFREHLKAQGFTPERLGVKDWSEVRPVGRDKAGQWPVMYVEGQEFQDARAIANMKALTSTLREAFGRDVPIGANYAPHPIFLPEEAQWVDAFREGALTMPWSEDYHWQVPIASPQIIGWILDVMRCGAKYHDLPMMFYCMPHSPGNTTENFRRSNYLALGRGVKYIHHFVNGPQPFSTENYVDWRDAERYQAIWDVIREAGRVDDLLYEGRPPKAEVAVLMCRYTDLWERSRGNDTYNLGGDNPNSNAYGIERQSVWLALKHAQVPVDLITEYDVKAGGLAGYKVLYLAGSHVSRETAGLIGAWVEAGGVLFSSAAGGFYDEYDRPSDVLLPVYGVESFTFEQRERCVRPKMELPRVEPLDTIKVRGGGLEFTMEALAVVSRFTPAEGGEVLGRFAGGGPAVVRRRYGQGTAYLVGSMPGLAYVKSAMPVRPFDRNTFAHFVPTDWPDEVRTLIALPLREAGVVRRVECSEPLVEGNLLESQRGAVVALASFADRPVEDLRVTIRLDRPVEKVWSVRQGKLEHRVVEGGVEVRLPMEMADFVVVE